MKLWTIQEIASGEAIQWIKSAEEPYQAMRDITAMIEREIPLDPKTHEELQLVDAAINNLHFVLHFAQRHIQAKYSQAPKPAAE